MVKAFYLYIMQDTKTKIFLSEILSTEDTTRKAFKTWIKETGAKVLRMERRRVGMVTVRTVYFI
jgi:hypothetical protein